MDKNTHSIIGTVPAERLKEHQKSINLKPFSTGKIKEFEFFIDSVDENNHVLYLRSCCKSGKELGCYSTLDEAIEKSRQLIDAISKEISKTEMNIAHEDYIKCKERYESYE